MVNILNVLFKTYVNHLYPKISNDTVKRDITDRIHRKDGMSSPI